MKNPEVALDFFPSPAHPTHKQGLSSSHTPSPSTGLHLSCQTPYTQPPSCLVSWPVPRKGIPGEGTVCAKFGRGTLVGRGIRASVETA